MAFLPAVQYGRINHRIMQLARLTLGDVELRELLFGDVAHAAAKHQVSDFHGCDGYRLIHRSAVPITGFTGFTGFIAAGRVIAISNSSAINWEKGISFSPGRRTIIVAVLFFLIGFFMDSPF